MIKDKKLRETGIRSEAIIVNLEVEKFNYKTNGMCYVVCKELENDKRPKTYKSSLMSYDYCVKKCPIGSFVPVYVERENSRHYFIDTECAYVDEKKFKKVCKDKKLEKLIEANRMITFENSHPEEVPLLDGWMLTVFGFLLLLLAIFQSRDFWVHSTPLGICAIFCVLIGVFVIIRQKARLRKASALIKNGIKYQATLQDIKRRDIYKGWGRHIVRHKLYFTAKNPINGKEESFKQESCEPKIRKECVESGVVDIYVDPNKPKNTFMDFSSCVLKIERKYGIF